MTQFNIRLLLWVVLPLCLFATYRGHAAGSAFVFLVGLMGSILAVFFGGLFIKARKGMKPIRK